MMKKALAALIAVTLAGVAHADIQINWRAQAGFYHNGTVGNFPNDGILFPSGSTIAMLIWSPDSVINDVDPSNVGGNYVGGNDLYLDTFVVSYPGSSLSEFADYLNGAEIYVNANYGGTLLQNGFVYARIFQDATPVAGEYYFDSPVLATTAYTGIEGAQLLDHNTDNTNGNELNKLIVPEPSVLAFLGAGALVVAFRRMRRA